MVCNFKKTHTICCLHLKSIVANRLFEKKVVYEFKRAFLKVRLKFGNFGFFYSIQTGVQDKIFKTISL